jgi:acetoin utilization protein AcuB
MTADEIMTRIPFTMHPTDPVSAAVDTLQAMNVRHLPIVDDRGHLIGMLSDRDLGPLMQRFTEGADADRMVVPLSERRISEFMSTATASVTPDDDVSEVVDRMLDERIGAVPVVDAAENVVGIVSYVDVLRALRASV